MADISNVDNATIKELYERLESLSCTEPHFTSWFVRWLTVISFSPDYDKDTILAQFVSSCGACLYQLLHIDKIFISIKTLGDRRAEGFVSICFVFGGGGGVLLTASVPNATKASQILKFSRSNARFASFCGHRR
ncbi:hypothetical protein BJY04DRAFT_33825 [Aspergillus karnatakaensis]|uniref:uncharacterized protein n=1 Tax=Aspergillus karnatakaensis TaxID=1810916 RepID=UPI003CCE03AB